MIRTKKKVDQMRQLNPTVGDDALFEFQFLAFSLFRSLNQPLKLTPVYAKRQNVMYSLGMKVQVL